MCGEKDIETLAKTYVTGSPPHVRGKVVKSGGHGPGIGITPACAGKRAMNNTTITIS